MDATKIAGLEEQIGPRGSAEIHSGKRTTLRAWLMERTGRTAASILHIGTADLGAIYNDTTDGKLNALRGAPPVGDAGPVIRDVTPKGYGPGEAAGQQGDQQQGDQQQGEGETPKPAPRQESALDARVREIAREEDVILTKSVRAALARLATPKAAPEVDTAKVREIAADEIKKAVGAQPERVIIVKERADGKEGAREDAGQQHRMFPLLLKTVEAGIPAALVGPAGAGKTFAGEAVAAALHGGRFELQGACVTKTDITGFVDAGGRYQTTPFSRSWVNGGVFLGDEMDAWQPNATLALNAALANGHVALPTGMARRAADWAAIFAMNTYGTGASRQYVGRNQMDAATLDRLAFIAWDYDAALEASMIGAKAAPGAGPIDLTLGGIPTADAWLRRVHTLRAAVESLKVRHIISPRASKGGVALFAVGVGQSWAEDMLIWKGMDAEQRARVETKAREIAAVGGR